MSGQSAQRAINYKSDETNLHISNNNGKISSLVVQLFEYRLSACKKQLIETIENKQSDKIQICQKVIDLMDVLNNIAELPRKNLSKSTEGCRRESKHLIDQVMEEYKINGTTIYENKKNQFQ